MKRFSVDSQTKIMEIEMYLKNNSYQSGTHHPGSNDAKLMNLQEGAGNHIDPTSYPSVYSWWWSLCRFTKEARQLWIDKEDANKSFVSIGLTPSLEKDDTIELAKIFSKDCAKEEDLKIEKTQSFPGDNNANGVRKITREWSTDVKPSDTD